MPSQQPLIAVYPETILLVLVLLAIAAVIVFIFKDAIISRISDWFSGMVKQSLSDSVKGVLP